MPSEIPNVEANTTGQPYLNSRNCDVSNAIECYRLIIIVQRSQTGAAS